MRFLLVLHYPGYLRYFDSTIELLARRGHDVHVGFELPRKQDEGLEALAALDPEVAEHVYVLDAVPARPDLWRNIARDVRTTIDFARYLHPRYREARYLRQRMERHVPRLARPLTRVRSLPPRALAWLLAALKALERSIPSSGAIEQLLRGVAPDAVIVSPLVTDGSRQTDFVKSARALGIPCALAVASWDHLTTKGLVRLEPDLVLLWNAAQRDEAVALHAVSPERIVVTGAQPFDRWFGRRPRRQREEFCRAVGLPAEKPYVLFTGSTESISAPRAEVAFVRRWIAALRASAPSPLADVGVMVRPHPYNTGTWRDEDLSDLGDVVVWPRDGANPVDEDDRAEYFDSIHHSAAVVGINTSAMIEAAVQRRPVLTVLASEFADTQGGTLHFRYLLPENGGFLRVAESLDEHLRQLAEVVLSPSVVHEQIERFLASFVRPHGLQVAATPLVADACERLARLAVARGRYAPWLYPLRWGLWSMGLVGALVNPDRRPGRRRGAPRRVHSVPATQLRQRVPAQLARGAP